MRKLSPTLMNLRPKKRLVLNLPTWREKDGDNGMDRVASIMHTFHYYLVGMDNNVKKDLTVTLAHEILLPE